MTSLYRSFVAGTIHNLVNQLDAHQGQAKIRLEPWDDQQNVARVQLDLRDAEVFEDSALFPDIEGSNPLDWCVFSINKVDLRAGSSAYKFIKRLRGGVGEGEFVKEAHNTLLLRPIEPEYEQVFVQLLLDSTMTRRQMLAVLIRSIEAKELGSRVIIVPSPTSWSKEFDTVTSNQLEILAGAFH